MHLPTVPTSLPPRAQAQERVEGAEGQAWSIEGPGGLGVPCVRVGAPKEFTQGQEWPGVLGPSGSFVPRGLCPRSIAQVRSYRLGGRKPGHEGTEALWDRVEPEEEVEGNGATPGVLS
ncbi:hypothetical protein H8959_021428 [Pygathrix nigripes]